jgi:hypothetical protein
MKLDKDEGQPDDSDQSSRGIAMSQNEHNYLYTNSPK